MGGWDKCGLGKRRGRHGGRHPEFANEASRGRGRGGLESVLLRASRVRVVVVVAKLGSVGEEKGEGKSGNGRRVPRRLESPSVCVVESATPCRVWAGKSSAAGLFVFLLFVPLETRQVVFREGNGDSEVL